MAGAAPRVASAALRLHLRHGGRAVRRRDAGRSPRQADRHAAWQQARLPRRVARYHLRLAPRHLAHHHPQRDVRRHRRGRPHRPHRPRRRRHVQPQRLLRPCVRRRAHHRHRPRADCRRRLHDGPRGRDGLGQLQGVPPRLPHDQRDASHLLDRKRRRRRPRHLHGARAARRPSRLPPLPLRRLTAPRRAAPPEGRRREAGVPRLLRRLLAARDGARPHRQADGKLRRAGGARRALAVRLAAGDDDVDCERRRVPGALGLPDPLAAAGGRGVAPRTRLGATATSPPLTRGAVW
mmetsp:Transcript_18913/g.47242  ORF Transcript_18913/g.47242 Transcript_18913/m.47242 type:complete len:293 (+) Transcript_18913:223-1101(+)